MRWITFLSLLVAALTGASLYLVSQRVQQAEAKLQRLNRDIVAQEEAIHVLKAEWSYLNTPERLKKLAEEKTDLRPVDGVQIEEIASLPERPPTPVVPEIKPIGADDGKDGGADEAPIMAQNETHDDAGVVAVLPPLPKHKPHYTRPLATAKAAHKPTPATKVAQQEKSEKGPAPRDSKRQFNMLLADLTGE